jgi:hypothetical protein
MIPRDDSLWNAPFGAARDWTQIRTVDEAIRFFEEGRMASTGLEQRG